MLRVIRYFAKSRSLKVIQNDTLEQGVCKSLLVVHCNYVSVFSVSETLNVKVIENGTNRKHGYGFLFAFHSNYGRVFSRFDTIHERVRHEPSQTPYDGIGRAYA